MNYPMTAETRWRIDIDIDICLACGEEFDKDDLSDDGLCCECLHREARPSWLTADSDWEDGI